MSADRDLLWVVSTNQFVIIILIAKVKLAAAATADNHNQLGRHEYLRHKFIRKRLAVHHIQSRSWSVWVFLLSFSSKSETEMTNLHSPNIGQRMLKNVSFVRCFVRMKLIRLRATALSVNTIHVYYHITTALERVTNEQMTAKNKW